MTDAHWDRLYREKRAEAVSWRQDEPALSLKLITRTGIGHGAPIIDVGGGASTLVDHLLKDGYRDLTILDIAAPGLDQAKTRLGGAADNAKWIVADVTTWRPPRKHRLWHDRAVLHFLADPSAQRAYIETLRTALDGDGWAIIAGFAPGGPAKCSGLEIVQHDGASLAKLLGDDFQLMETHGEIHVTPSGAEQAFRYHLFRRNAGSAAS
ncbi:MAG: class I SAM-dependent methyltransferase [Rhodospirillales bacterium]|nr:class I SAM-dependent methyltransferase [Rhodospirillales bacterium]